MAETLLHNIAVLIDADNAMVHSVPAALRQIALAGRISLKRAYGNWTKEILSSWEPVLKDEAIHPMHQIDFVKDKNATDIALCIDAMDLLHSGIYDGFAILSSDSDFTPLAIRLKESGAKVIVCGGGNAPTSLIKACDTFYRFDGSGKQVSEDTAKSKKKRVQKDPEELHALLREAYESYKREDGFALLSQAGLYINRSLPDYDVRDYGETGLGAFLEKYEDLYELRSSLTTTGPAVLSYRCK